MPSSTSSTAPSIGKRAVLELVLLGLLADGHVLLDDLPGVAKTLIARSLATVTGLSFARIQFTPDLLPADITGGVVLDPVHQDVVFRPGPGVRQPRAGRRGEPGAGQDAGGAARGHAGAPGHRRRRHPRAAEAVPRVATQNPIEYEGTYPLPEAQLDRFILRTTVGYPTPDDEWDIVARRLERGTDDVELQAGRRRRRRRGAAALARGRARRASRVGRYVVAIVDATRHDSRAAGGRQPAGHARRPSSWPAPTRCCGAATSSRPTT